MYGLFLLGHPVCLLTASPHKMRYVKTIQVERLSYTAAKPSHHRKLIVTKL